MSDLMSTGEIQNALAEVPGWDREGIAIVREFELETFSAAIAFVIGIAMSAEKLNHHPDIDIRYRKIRVAISTHSVGGLTDLDFSLARLCDGL